MNYNLFKKITPKGYLLILVVFIISMICDLLWNNALQNNKSKSKQKNKYDIVNNKSKSKNNSEEKINLPKRKLKRVSQMFSIYKNKDVKIIDSKIITRHDYNDSVLVNCNIENTTNKTIVDVYLHCYIWYGHGEHEYKIRHDFRKEINLKPHSINSYDFIEIINSAKKYNGSHKLSVEEYFYKR